MAKCIRCDENPPLGSQARCARAPDGGCHEFLPHRFKTGRLDGLCAEIDPDFGTMCGHVRDTEQSAYIPSSVFHCFTPKPAEQDGEYLHEAHVIIAEALACGGPVEDELDAATAVLDELARHGWHLLNADDAEKMLSA